MLKKVMALALAGVALSACSTDDVDIDAPLQVSLIADTTSVNEPGGVATITGNLNHAADVSVTFDLLVAGSATADTDYTLSATSALIPAGQTVATFTLTAIDDTSEEGFESVTLTLSNVQNAEAAAGSLEIQIVDDDVPLAPILNEVLYDPPDGIAGDANGDGTRDANQDEFVELVNVGTDPMDVSGLLIYDSTGLASSTPRHTVPAGTVLAAKQALVIFGGGTPTGTFGGAIVQTATGGQINLNNGADVLTITQPDGAVVVSFDINTLSANPNESYTRKPDLTGDFVQHHSAEAGVFFSPGTRADGTSF